LPKNLSAGTAHALERGCGHRADERRVTSRSTETGRD
jgi:hypothetical protein